MLLSIGQFCKAGITTTFTKSTVTISNKNGIDILKGVQNGSNGMWTINM